MGAMPTTKLRHVLEISHQYFSADKARTLLRRLRDLNSRAGPIAVRAGLTVFLCGCSSIDAPAESGVRYRLRANDGSEGAIELAWTDRGLALALSGAISGAVTTRIYVPMTCDRKGRACAKELGARVVPESTSERELEHFLRRAVRTLMA
jgi:hypothetical protein